MPSSHCRCSSKYLAGHSSHDNEKSDAEVEALRALIDRRRAGAFVDLDEGDADTRAMLERKRRARAAV